LIMTGNLVSFEDCRLAKLDCTLFGSSAEESIIATTVGRLEARIKERDTGRDSIEHLESGEVLLHPDDASAPSPPPLAQLVDPLAITGHDQLMFFAGLWVRDWTSVRKVKDALVTIDLFGFLTTKPNAVVALIHPWDEAKALQRPLADDLRKIEPVMDAVA
jgi:hypothetical protein